MIPHIRLVKQNWLPDSAITGWGNGYVVLPRSNKYHGCSYDVLNDLFRSKFSHEITYAEAGENGSWVIGFDTCHGWCNPENCSIEQVEKWAEELLNLVNQ